MAEMSARQMADEIMATNDLGLGKPTWDQRARNMGGAGAAKHLEDERNLALARQGIYGDWFSKAPITEPVARKVQLRKSPVKQIAGFSSSSDGADSESSRRLECFERQTPSYTPLRDLESLQKDLATLKAQHRQAFHSNESEL